jgi:hypothetical protein
MTNDSVKGTADLTWLGSPPLRVRFTRSACQLGTDTVCHRLPSLAVPAGDTHAEMGGVGAYSRFASGLV